MRAIKFTVVGLLNSFRVPDFQTYHKTLLFPPKTTVCGMLGAALGWSPQMVNDKIIPEVQIAIQIQNLVSPFRDLWKIKKIIKKADSSKPDAVIINNHTYYGAVMIRELLFQPGYIIYLKSENGELIKQIFKKITNPEWALSLGRDDELVIIKKLRWVELSQAEAPIFENAVLPFDISGKYRIDPHSLKAENGSRKLTPPIINKLPILFKYTGNVRTALQFQTFSVIIGLRIILKESQPCFTDGENTIIFF